MFAYLQDPSQRQRRGLLHRRQPDGRGRVGVHLDEVPLLPGRLREEDPAGGSDLLRQRLPAQQVRTLPGWAGQAALEPARQSIHFLFPSQATAATLAQKQNPQNASVDQPFGSVPHERVWQISSIFFSSAPF